MGNYQNMGRQSTDPRERYIANTQGGHPNMSKYGYPMQDRGPVTMSPIMAAVENPQVMSDLMYKYDLENQMDPNNFLTNRIAVGEQFNVDPFGDIFQYNQQRLLPTGRTLFGDEDERAAVDSSDWRTLEKILGAGGNPDDYVQMAGLDDDDDYGPFIPPSVLEWDRDFQYGPADEYEFDYIKGLDAFPDFKPEYSARGGIMSLKR